MIPFFDLCQVIVSGFLDMLLNSLNLRGIPTSSFFLEAPSLNQLFSNTVHL